MGVKRFDIDGTSVEFEHGLFVLHSDYAALEQKLATAIEVAGEDDARIGELQERIKELERAVDDYESALDRLDNWRKAYPLDMFPEPDMKKARELLEAGGITLGAVSASNMRHVLNGLGEIAQKALRGEEE